LIRFILVLGWVVLGGVAAGDEPKDEVKRAAVAKALEAFTGTWEIIAVMPKGATKGARQLVFHMDGNYAAQDKGGKDLWAGTFEIDPTVSPIVWDHRSHGAKKEGQDVLGIYQLDGDTLRVACVGGRWKTKEWVGKSRPKGFDMKQADVVIELKRVKAGK
jgi:uncharacterized protein (TIGR03067 family)